MYNTEYIIGITYTNVILRHCVRHSRFFIFFFKFTAARSMSEPALRAATAALDDGSH